MRVVADDLCFTGYKGNSLKNISFNLETGRCLVISGLSGSGKSLLLSLICGLVTANTGSVSFDKMTILQMNDEQNAIFRRKLGVIFQQPALLSNLTTAENLMLPLTQHYPLLSDKEKSALILKCGKQFELHDFMDDRAQIALFGNNLTDKAYMIYAQNLVPYFGLVSAVYGQPRSFGGEISYRF